MSSPWSDPPAPEDLVPLVHAPRGEDAQMNGHTLYAVEKTCEGLIRENFALKAALEGERFFTGLAVATSITGWVTAILIWIF